MKIAFNPSTVAALTSPPKNKDITFDLRGRNIFARGVEFKGTDTNTWRDIKVNNVSIGSHTLDLRNGSNTTLTNSNGVVTINSTWRPVVDSLTSNSTTSSLSANQGRVLAGLINSKSDSDHNHDDRYLKLTGGTMSGTIYRKSGGSTIDGRNNAIIRQTHAPGGSSWNPIACVDTETGTWTLGHLSSGSSNTDFSFCFSTNADYNAGNNVGNYVTLRNKGGVIALTSDIPNKSSWNYDDRYYTKTESDTKYITDITTSINKLTFTKNGSNITRDITVNNVQSLGRRSPLTERNAISGIYTYGTYSATDNLAPSSYFETLGFGEGTGGTIEIGGSWISSGRLYWRALRDVSDNWFSWRTILDTSNYSNILDSRYYTETEVNNLLSKKLDRVNLTTGSWNPRSYNLAADYFYNGGDLSISESKGQIHVSIDGYFWQNEGQYRVLDTSDIAGLKNAITLHQYLSNTDTTWWPLIWGGSSHNNTSDSTGAVYKSHDKLSWQTSSQTLYATRFRTTFIDLENNRGISRVTTGGTSPYKGIKLPDLQSNGLGMFSRFSNSTDEGGIIISEDTSVIYNSFDTGWGLSVRDKNLNQTDISNDNTIAFGVRQDHRAYSLGGFKKAGSNNSYVLLGGGDHKLESALSVANADTVDGYHASHLLVKRGRLGAYNIDKETTFGTRDIQPASEITISGKKPFDGWGTLLVIGSIDGASNHQLAFTGDNRMFIRCAYGTTNNYNTKDWAIVALTSDNVASASKLQTARNIWGQRFDGTADVDNTLRIRKTTGNYCEGIRIQTGDGAWSTIILGATADSGTNTNAWSIHRKSDNNFAISRNSSDGANGLVMTPTGMGLGTTSPTQRLDVAGNIRTTGDIYITHATNNNMNYNTSNPRIVFSESGTQAVGLVYTDYNSYRPSKGLKVMDTDNVDTGNVWFEVQGYNYSSGYVKNGGNENQLLRADGGVAGFNWAGQSGQPTWLWGGNNFNSYYVYNPSNFRVAYAASAGNAEKLGGMSKNYGQSPFGTIPCVGGDGVMEIGRYINYHYDNSGKHDFSTRLQTTGNYGNVVSLPSASGTLALTSQVLTWKSQIIDMRNYSESYWHPVTVPLPNAGYNKIKVSVQLNSGDKPSWATHDSGITCNMEIWATSSGWGITDSDTICLNYTYKFCSQNPCGWMQLTSPSLGVVFLRGGSRYTVYTDFDAVFTPHNQKYTWSSGSSSQDTGGPYTSCPGLNFNIGTIRTDLIATLVQARRVCAGHDPGIDNSISCSNWFRSSGNTGWYNTTYEGGWYMSDTSWIRAYNSVGIYTGGQIYSSSSIRAGNICLEHTDEINNITGGGVNLNYRNSGNVSLCQGGGNVGIGTMSPYHKLDVNGGAQATGFYHKNHDSNDAVLLAGGGYSLLNTLIFVSSYNYKGTNYNLTFHKLSGICNNLVWVDGYVRGPVTDHFYIDSKVWAYMYGNIADLRTTYTMRNDDYISVDAAGYVFIKCNNSHRIGFFYTGKA